MGPAHVTLSLPLSLHTIHNSNVFSIPVHAAIPLNVTSHSVSELHQTPWGLSVSACLRVSVFIAAVAGYNTIGPQDYELLLC